MARFEIALPARRRRTPQLRVVLVGLGPIGVAVGRALLDDPSYRIVGAVDQDPKLAGRPLRRVLRSRSPARVEIVPRVRDLPVRADAAVLCTGSRLKDVAPQVMALLAKKLHVVTTCEELLHPVRQNRSAARRLDERARRHGRVVVGGGINPGFVLDVLPLTLITAATRVDRIEGERTVDARTRRRPLQRKVCVGGAPAEVRRAIREGTVGHVGLLDSALYVADRLRWPVDLAVRTLNPVIAKRRIHGPIPVRRGEVAGLRETVKLYERGTLRVSLTLVMAAGARPVRDRIRVAGSPRLDLVAEGGFPGDEGTVAQVLHLLERVPEAPPGLWSPGDLPAVGRGAVRSALSRSSSRG